MAFTRWCRHPVFLYTVLLFVVFVALCLPEAAAATPIRVTVDGRALTMDVPPTVRDGRTLVPMRAIFEALGARVSWDPQTKKITGTRGATVIILQVGRTTATVDGRTISLDVPPLLLGGRTLVPTRFIAEHLGAQVNWDSSARLVTVGSGAAPGLPGAGGAAATITLPDGSRYTGALLNGVPHGYGSSTAANGERYSGAWENGLRHGVGVLTFQNGTSRTGVWNRGELAQWLSPDPDFR
ncbi:MAG: Protease inhibitor [Firmicutes bacterium]|nr:Protease inhibitor [candidate division NPL-UPA2 bacterium]